MINTIMLVDLCLDASKQQEFDRFYHDIYIPDFVTAIPELTSAARFAPQQPSSDSHFLTIYGVSSDDAMDAIETGIGNNLHRESFAQFKQWKQNEFSFFDRAFYTRVGHRVSQPNYAYWSAPALCVWNWEAKSGVSAEEAVLRLSKYADGLAADPRVLAHHTYRRMNSEPGSFITVFEVFGDASPVMSILEHALIKSDSPLRNEWLDTVAASPVATSFLRIYEFNG